MESPFPPMITYRPSRVSNVADGTTPAAPHCWVSNQRLRVYESRLRSSRLPAGTEVSALRHWAEKGLPHALLPMSGSESRQMSHQ